MQKELGEFNLAPSKVLASAATGVVDLIKRNHWDVDVIFDQVGIHRTDISIRLTLSISTNTAPCLMLPPESRAMTILDWNLVGVSRRNIWVPLAPPQSALQPCPPHYADGKIFSRPSGTNHFGLIEDDNILWLSYRIHDSRIQNRRQDAELSLGMFHNIFKVALGANWSPLEIYFEHDRPDNFQDHEMYFGAPVRFGRRTNAFAFRHRDLDARMPD